MRGRFLCSANPMFNTWCLSGFPPILVRYTIILIVVSGRQLPASAYQIKGSGGKFNIWNSSIAIQRHLQTKTHTQFSETCDVKTINISIWWITCTLVCDIFMCYSISDHICQGDNEDQNHVVTGLFVICEYISLLLDSRLITIHE